MRHRIELYKDDAGEWRWRIRARNGRIVAESGEGYKERRKALHPLYELLELPEPGRVNGSQWHGDTRVTVQLKGGNIERVVWQRFRGGFDYRSFSMDVIA